MLEKASEGVKAEKEKRELKEIVNYYNKILLFSDQPLKDFKLHRPLPITALEADCMYMNNLPTDMAVHPQGAQLINYKELASKDT